MAVGEFADADGVRWRVWSVDPDSMHPTTKTEALTAEFVEGWLVFEREDGSEKRRLTPIPQGWEHAGTDELRSWLRRAPSVVRRLRAATASTTEPAPEATDTAKGPGAPTPPLRSFRFPGGRFWTVTLYEPPGGARSLLRFMAGGRIVDLDAWPADWADFDDQQLSELLRLADQRRRTSEDPRPEKHPKRRQDDRRP